MPHNFGPISPNPPVPPFLPYTLAYDGSIIYDPPPAGPAVPTADTRARASQPIPLHPGKQEYECRSHGCYMLAGPSGYCPDCEPRHINAARAASNADDSQ